MAKKNLAENKQGKDKVLKLKPKKLQELAALVDLQWSSADASRSQWLADRKEGLEVYWGIKKPKNFPFKNCLSKDTEILTAGGWKGVATITTEDTVLTRRDADGQMEWARVEDTPSVYASRMIRFSSNSLDLMVTPDHEMIVRNQDGKTRRMLAKELYSKTGYRIPLSGEKYSFLPRDIFGLDPRDVAEFVGWYLSEGNHNKKPGGPPGTIFIAQSRDANPEKCQRIEALLNRLGFRWSYSRHTFIVHIGSIPSGLVNMIHAQGTCSEKFVPRLFMGLGAETAEALLTGLILGDGNTHPQNGETFYTTSPRLADDVQALALYCGKRATIIPREAAGHESEIRGQLVVSRKTGYSVRICKRLWAKVDAAKKEYVEYNDTAHCVTVKNHSIYARRNGVPAFVGNCANLHIPLTRVVTDTLHANLIGSLDMVKPVSVMPVGPEDVPRANKIEKLMNWQFTAQVDYSEIADRILNTALVYGVAPVKVRYVIEKDGGRKKYDGIKVDVLTPERVLIPGDAPNSNVDDMDFIGQEIPMSKSDIRKRVNSGLYASVKERDLEKMEDMHSRAAREGDNLLENVRDLYSGIQSSGTESGKRYGTVLEWYTNFDVDGDGVEESVMVTVLKEAKTVLRVVLWDDPRPFVLVKMTDVLGRAYGESVPDLLVRVNQELNTIRNQRVDARTIQNIPFFFYDPMSGFNPDKIELTPGVGIPTNGPPSQAVFFPTLNGQAAGDASEEDRLFLVAERLLGAGANVQGIMLSKRATATEISSVDRRAGIRFLTIFTRIRKGLKDVFSLALSLNRKYMPPQLQARIIGPESDKPIFERIAKADLLAQVDVMINGNSIVDDQAEKQEMFQAYQIGMSNPLVARDENAVYELTRDLYKKLGIKRIDAYLRKPADSVPKNPEEEHALFLQESEVEPNLSEDVERHLDKHAAMIESEGFKSYSPKGKALLLGHYQRTLKMKALIEQARKVQQAAQVNAQLLALEQSRGGPDVGNVGAPRPVPDPATR